jgi:hypothetical protein
VAGQQRRRVRISPRIAGAFGCLVAAVLGYGAVTVIGQGHGALGTRWRAAVLIGGGASIGLLVLIAGVLALGRALARRHPRAPRALYPVAMVLAGALVLIAWAGTHVAGGGGLVTSPWQVGLAASFVPVALVAIVVIPLLTWPRRSPGGAGAGAKRVVAVTISARGDGWSVSWTGMGRMPRTLRAATLTNAADAADHALRAMAPHRHDTAEARIVIYSGRYRGGPTFDIAGEPGDLTATSADDPGQTVGGMTLEDLASAVKETLADDCRGFRLRWTRAITPETHAQP